MAEIDKVPLLLEDEKEILDEEEFEEDETFYDRHPEGIEKVSSVQSEMLDLSESGKRRRRYYIHNTELIVAIFVVAFDTKKGMDICMYVCRHTCESVSMYMYACIRMYVHVYICESVSMYMYVCMYIHVYICESVSMYMYVYMYMYIVYMYVHVYMYMYMYHIMYYLI